MSQLRVLKTELAILEKQFPRNNGPFQIILAATEELVCRFVDTKGNKYNLQCNISVRKEGGREEGERKEGNVDMFIFPLSAELPCGTSHLDLRM